MQKYSGVLYSYLFVERIRGYLHISKNVTGFVNAADGCTQFRPVFLPGPEIL
jgi:hypothetical protein